MSPLELVDPTTNPHLSGRFAPVHREIDARDLTVEGTLPAELTGAYVRNGPNPKFPPLGSYTYPMEGDAMLHGVWLDGDVSGARAHPPTGAQRPARELVRGRLSRAARREDRGTTS